LAAAASFEALFQAERLNDALRLLPRLAKESAVRYRPRLNLALLKASDKLVEVGRVNDAALTLNLIKTTDIMIDWQEGEVDSKTAQVEQRSALGNASKEFIERLQQEVTTLEANLEHLRKLPSNTPPAENLELPSEHIVEIFPNGLILLNGAPMDGIDDPNMNRLSTTLSRLKLSSDRAGIDTVVKIQADPDSPHQRAIDVLNASARADITKVSFASYAE
jgi:biopolymer transport protein ExbD